MLGALGIFILVLFCLTCLGAIAWVLYLHLRARRYNLPAPTLASYFRQPNSSYQSSYTPRPRSEDSGILSKLKNLIPGANKSRHKRNINSTGRGNFGPVGDDAAWDTRGYYEEEAEIGLDPPRSGAGAGAGAGSGGVVGGSIPQINTTNNTSGYHGQSRSAAGGGGGRYDDSDPESPPRGRSRSRSPRYSVEDQRHGQFIAQPPLSSPQLGQQQQQQQQQQGLRGVGGVGGTAENPFSDRHEMNDGFGKPVGVKGGSGLVGDSPTSAHSERKSLFREGSI